MKNLAPLFIVIFSINCIAQQKNRIPSDAEENTELLSQSLSDNELAVVSYHVEERINMAFGSTVTTYDVSSLSLINTNDLGKNNSRIITPKYKKSKEKALALNTIKAKNLVDTPIDIKPIKFEMAPPPDSKQKYVEIDKIGTYERILERGYSSVEMLKKVGDRRFFAGDLTLSAKWYSELFSKTTDFDPVYYYRYAQSLNSIGQIEKSKAMMILFKNKSL